MRHFRCVSQRWFVVSEGTVACEHAVHCKWTQLTNGCQGGASWRAWPLAVHPPYGRSLGQADLDQLRQAVLPVQDVSVLQSVHQFVGCLPLRRPLLDQRLNAQRGQVLQQRGLSSVWWITLQNKTYAKIWLRCVQSMMKDAFCAAFFAMCGKLCFNLLYFFFYLKASYIFLY